MDSLRRAALTSVWLSLLCGCPSTPPAVDGGLTVADASVSCADCVQSSDCTDAVCAQVAGTDGCFVACGATVACPEGYGCQPVVTSDGTQASVCVPTAGCGGQACPATCPVDTVCDPVVAQCVAVPPDGGTCPGYDGPGTASCCHSCTAGSAGCQANGCYGGWNCEASGCRCVAPTATCGPTAIDAGVVGGPITGTVGLDGGAVSRLYFAVVGDTRPAIIGDTGNYPTATITGIFDAIEAMDPRPSFVIGTGDYAFASPLGAQGGAQMDLYLGARAHFTGPVFPAMGNHECTGATAVNCTGLTASSSSLYSAYMDKMVKPIGRTTPYFTFDVNDVGGAWTSKFIVTACNAWDATQLGWVQTELARPTTYTFVIRHIPLGVSAPCTSQMDTVLAGANYTGILVGHTHTYSHSGKQLVEGVGGAPLSGSAGFGYATVEQLPSGKMKVTQYESATRAAVSTFELP